MIKAEAGTPSLGIGIKIPEQYSVQKIIHHSWQSRNHQRQRIGKHHLEQFCIQFESQAKDIWNKKEAADYATDENCKDDITEIWSGRNQMKQPRCIAGLCCIEAIFRKNQEKKEVGGCFRNNLDSFEDCKFQGLVLLTEFCKEDGRYTVQGKDSAYIDDAGGISLIAKSS